MSRKIRTQEIIENVVVIDIADDGKAVGKVSDLVVFIFHA